MSKEEIEKILDQNESIITYKADKDFRDLTGSERTLLENNDKIKEYIEELEEKTNPGTIEYTGGNFENDIERYIKRGKKNRKFKELEAVHNRLINGTETIEDLLEHYRHYRMEFETKLGSIELDLIEVKYYKKLIRIVKKQNKVINEMVETLVGLTVWDSEKDEPFILGDKEEVKEYFEKKVEEQ